RAQRAALRLRAQAQPAPAGQALRRRRVPHARLLRAAPRAAAPRRAAPRLMRIAIAFLALPAALALLALLAAWAITSMPGRSHRGALPPLEPAARDLAARLRTHVAAIASEEHNVIRAEALERSARYIEGELARGGPVVRDEFSVAGVKVRNLEVVIPGGTADAPVLVVGANDNGSGVAALIELARSLREKPPGGSEIRLVAFVNEESPWFGTDAMGSLRHARALARAGKRVLGML